MESVYFCSALASCPHIFQLTYAHCFSRLMWLFKMGVVGG